MCFSVVLFYNYFLCGKRAFLCGESNSSKKGDFYQLLISLKYRSFLLCEHEYTLGVKFSYRLDTIYS
jgi:hypothetical protein